MARIVVDTDSQDPEDLALLLSVINKTLAEIRESKGSFWSRVKTTLEVTKMQQMKQMYRYGRQRPPYGPEVPSFEFDTDAAAEAMMQRFRLVFEENKVLTYADVKRAYELPVLYADSMWGWADISDMLSVQNHSTWTIVFPEATRLGI